MKTSKRSLITAIAILCVCALSLSAASYAWFSQSNKATVNNIVLAVDRASDLQISEDGKTWVSNITLDGEQTVADASTADAQSFYTPVDREGVDIDTGAYAGEYKTGEAVVYTKTIYFRSSNAVNVNAAIDEFTLAAGNNTALANAMRMSAYVDGAATFFANVAGNDDVISATDGTTANVTLVGAATKAEIVDVLNGSYSASDITVQEGYYYGKATFTFYVEGTDAAAINANTGVNFKTAITFTTDGVQA